MLRTRFMSIAGISPGVMQESFRILKPEGCINGITRLPMIAPGVTTFPGVAAGELL